MKTPFFKQKKVKTWLKIVLGIALSILSSRIATTDNEVNKGLQTIINETGSILIDILTSDLSTQNDTIQHVDSAYLMPLN